MSRISYHKIFDTEQEAIEWMNKEYRNYGYGYGTSLNEKLREDGKWHVTGYRYSSCD